MSYQNHTFPAVDHSYMRLTLQLSLSVTVVVWHFFFSPPWMVSHMMSVTCLRSYCRTQPKSLKLSGHVCVCLRFITDPILAKFDKGDESDFEQYQLTVLLCLVLYRTVMVIFCGDGS